MADAIQANRLVKTYPPDIRALDELSLSVPAGAIFGLLGPMARASRRPSGC